MKKRIVILMLVLAMTVMALTGCGKKSSAPVVGDWKMTTIEVSGMTLNVDQFLAMAGQDDVNMTLTISADGKFSMDVAGEKAEGTWKYKDSICTLTADGEDVDAEYKDGKLVMSMDEGTMTFEK
ncbi:lipocalin family protein [Lacrimispora sp. NSJ-141]|uniref:Lipocalin family protein n=1 Tax=Lientehia hominis TaxID=2897778 RepID=A0AAP2W7J4_9FIRM|nr:lipocalin family protein [Lientehia hominis]MCD2491081.1 lipocalin family protein [Lientehia hominis]